MTNELPFTIHPIDIRTLASVRDTSLDASGNTVEYVVAEGGEPLRCCLRDADAGEQCILFGYAPPMPRDDTPYRQLSAVFAHACDCETGAIVGYPPSWTTRAQVLRCYDARGWIHPATTTHDGADPVTAIATLLAEPGVVQLHSLNIAYGCYMFSATATAAETEAQR